LGQRKIFLLKQRMTLELNFIDHTTIWRQMILRSVWKPSQRRRRTGLKQKHFGMRRRTTELKHLCDKNYNIAEDKMDSGGGGSDGGGGERRSAAVGGRAQRGQTMAVDIQWQGG
jgi:hypothetical protein